MCTWILCCYGYKKTIVEVAHLLFHCARYITHTFKFKLLFTLFSLIIATCFSATLSSLLLSPLLLLLLFSLVRSAKVLRKAPRRRGAIRSPAASGDASAAMRSSCCANTCFSMRFDLTEVARLRVCQILSVIRTTTN